MSLRGRFFEKKEAGESRRWGGGFRTMVAWGEKKEEEKSAFAFTESCPSIFPFWDFHLQHTGTRQALTNLISQAVRAAEHEPVPCQFQNKAFADC